MGDRGARVVRAADPASRLWPSRAPSGLAGRQAPQRLIARPAQRPRQVLGPACAPPIRAEYCLRPSPGASPPFAAFGDCPSTLLPLPPTFHNSRLSVQKLLSALQTAEGPHEPECGIGQTQQRTARPPSLAAHRPAEFISHSLTTTSTKFRNTHLERWWCRMSWEDQGRQYHM